MMSYLVGSLCGFYEDFSFHLRVKSEIVYITNFEKSYNYGSTSRIQE